MTAPSVFEPSEAPEYPGDIDESSVPAATAIVSPDEAPEYPGDVRFVTAVDKILNKAKAIAAAVGGGAAYEVVTHVVPDGSVKNWILGVGIPACAGIAAYIVRNRGQIDVLAKDAYDVYETVGRHAA